MAEQTVTSEVVHGYIMQFFNGIGLAKTDVYVPEEDTYYWMRGSARLQMFISPIPMGNGSTRYYLRLFSPLMMKPAKNSEHFYRTLLQLNHNSLCVKLTMRAELEYVFACYERDIEGMDYREFYTFLTDLAWWADDLDDRLKGMFPEEPTVMNPNAAPPGAPPQV